MQMGKKKKKRLFKERRLTAGQCEDFSQATVGEEEHFSFFSIRMHQSRAVLHERTAANDVCGVLSSAV